LSQINKTDNVRISYYRH